MVTMNLKVIAMLLATSVGGAVELQGQSSSASLEKPPIRHLVQPIIPELANRLSLSGMVRIEATVAPDGTVKKNRILGGHPVLAVEAEKAAQKSSFEKASTETVEIIECRFSN
jgi:outer membrane biosynthesis protein TonB